MQYVFRGVRLDLAWKSYLVWNLLELKTDFIMNTKISIGRI